MINKELNTNFLDKFAKEPDNKKLKYYLENYSITSIEFTDEDYLSNNRDYLGKIDDYAYKYIQDSEEKFRFFYLDESGRKCQKYITGFNFFFLDESGFKRKVFIRCHDERLKPLMAYLFENINSQELPEETSIKNERKKLLKKVKIIKTLRPIFTIAVSLWLFIPPLSVWKLLLMIYCISTSNLVLSIRDYFGEYPFDNTYKIISELDDKYENIQKLKQSIENVYNFSLGKNSDIYDNSLPSERILLDSQQKAHDEFMEQIRWFREAKQISPNTKSIPKPNPEERTLVIDGRVRRYRSQSEYEKRKKMLEEEKAYLESIKQSTKNDIESKEEQPRHKF